MLREARTTAAQLAPFQAPTFRAISVRPGVIDTEIQPPGRAEKMAPLIPLQRAGQAHEVATAILWLLSDEASYTTGANLDVSGAR